ncbi:MAG: M48 family metallopeptidase [Zoogloeaceae bacterium]|nr:M48 family metallopeptidase [Zoogloeaceae bacterium]
MAVAAAGPRRIELNGVTVDYLLQRSARRSVALRVDARGVRVGVPLALPLRSVEGFLREHAGWLLDKLAQRAARSAAEPWRLVDGAQVSVFGEPVRIALTSALRTHRWVRGQDGGEVVELPQRHPERALIRALEERGLAWFRDRVAHFCEQLGHPSPAVRLTRAQTRWGSCSTRSGIRLHWRLVHLAPTLIDYVVAHEVAHLMEMNHSPRFWAAVEHLYPSWREARRALRRAAADLPSIVPGDAGRPLNEE